jgi:hypothetical protein
VIAPALRDLSRSALHHARSQKNSPDAIPSNISSFDSTMFCRQ